MTNLHAQTLHHIDGKAPSIWKRGDKRAIKEFFELLGIGCRFDECEEVWFNPGSMKCSKDDCLYAGGNAEEILDTSRAYMGGSDKWSDAQKHLMNHFFGPVE